MRWSADTSAVVTANGGKVLGGVKAPDQHPDFSSFLLQAQASKAKVIGLANAGGDTTNSIKQAAEFGIVAAARSSPRCCCSSTTCIRWA
jgi:branched-chain amino acid transport system substrate-binding protein